MTIQFKIGRSGSGKTYDCLEEIKKYLNKDSMGAPIIYICPEQMTFQIEQQIARENGSIRANVYSFTRLAWKVLQEVGGSTRIHIEQQGVEMLLRKIVENNKEELKMYQRITEQSGFYSQLAEQIRELKQNEVNSEGLEHIYASIDNKMLQMKMEDIHLIYKKYEEAIQNQYIDGEDYLRLLAEKIPQSNFLKDSILYIDGFYSFSMQELDVISMLQHVCKEMKIVLTVEEVENHLFHVTQKTYEKLWAISKENNVHIQGDELFRENLRFQNQSLKELEFHFEQHPLHKSNERYGIHFTQCSSLRAEVEKIAREICRLIENNNVRYRNIALIGRNITDYLDLFQTIFHDYEIPFHTDEKKKMICHPYVEALLATFEMLESNWRMDAVFRGLKTGLLIEVADEKIDLLENYCLAYGVKGRDWVSSKRWEYGRFKHVKTDEDINKENEINQLRNEIVTPILSLAKKLKRAKNVREMCIAVYDYLEDFNFSSKLEKRSDEAEQRKNLLESKEHIQAWEGFIFLLEQLVEMLGEEVTPVETFLNMLRTGLEGLEFSNVPSSLDQVIIANLDHSRIESIDYAFLFGVNEGVIPAVRKEAGMLSDEDREILQKLGIEMNPTTKEGLMEEEFTFYMGCVRPSSRLYVSCSLSDREGKSLYPSVFYKRLKEMFPLIIEQYVTEDSLTTGEEESLLISKPFPTLTLLMEKLLLFKEKQLELGNWWNVYHAYLHQEPKSFYSRIFNSLVYQNESKQLTETVSSVLYGNEIMGSVSRIESFNQCPYQHFANYGLNLKERNILKLEAPDIGQLFHDALKKVTDTMLETNMRWWDLTRQMCEKLAYDAIEEIAPQIQREILLSTNRYHYIKHKLFQIIYRTTIVLAEQGKKSNFTPIGIEVPFGDTQRIPSLQFSLPNGKTMGLVGRIDRVDSAETDSGTYLRIVDYKSTSKDLDLNEVYYGLALQMLTYLDIAVTHSEKWIGSKTVPAGMLYFHVHNPMVDASKMVLNNEVDEATIEEELVKKFKMKGLILAESEVAKMMDTSLKEGASSSIISVGIKKDGNFRAGSSIATMDEFQKLTEHVRKQYVDVGTKITEGVIDIEPYKYKTKKACTFCEYKSVCQFDDSLGSNKQRVLRQRKRDEILSLIDEEGDES